MNSQSNNQSIQQVNGQSIYQSESRSFKASTMTSNGLIHDDQTSNQSNTHSHNQSDNQPNHQSDHQPIQSINNHRHSEPTNKYQSNNPSDDQSTPTNRFNRASTLDSINHIVTDQTNDQTMNVSPHLLRRVSPLDRRSGIRLRSSIHDQLINQSVNQPINRFTTTNQYILPPLRRTASGTKLSHKNFALIVNTRSVEDLSALRAINQANSQSNERNYYQLDQGAFRDQSSDSSPDEARTSLSINVLPPRSNQPSISRSNNQPSPIEPTLTITTDRSSQSLNQQPSTPPNDGSEINLTLPLTSELINVIPEAELLIEQLDGTLKKRGDSYLNLLLAGEQGSEPSSGKHDDQKPDAAPPVQPVELAVPIPPQLRATSGADRRVYFRTDGTDGLDLIELIKEERPAHDEVIDEETWKPRLPIKQLFPRPAPKHGVLRTVNIRGTDEEKRRRERRAAAREREWIAIMQAGALFTKYSWQDGKPQQRWFWVSEDTQDLCWEKPNNQWKKSPPLKLYDSDPEDMPNAPVSARSSSYTARVHRPPVVVPPLQSANSAPSIHEPRAKRRASLPSAMRIFSLKFQNDRKRSLLDISGVHYGPYRSTRFHRYLAHKDNMAGYPWLCMTIVFQDRTLDLVACDEVQVTNWFMGMQCLAPLTVHNLTLGGLLWRRLIMKINHFGLAPVKLEKISPWVETG